MLKFKFSTRLILGILLLEFIILGLLTWHSVYLITETQRVFSLQSIQDKNTLLTQMLLLAYKNAPDKMTPFTDTYLKNILRLMEDELNLVYLHIYNNRGEKISPTGPVDSQGIRIDYAYNGDVIQTGRFDSEQFLYANGQYLGFIRTGYDISNEQLETKKRVKNSLLFYGLAVVLAWLLTLLSGLLLVRRLGHLEAGALALQRGWLEYRIPVNEGCHDELNRLARAFNNLASHLEISQQKLKIEQQNLIQESLRLNTVLSSTKAFVWEAEPRNGQLTYISDDIAQHFGHSQSAWLSANFLAHQVHLEDYTALYQILTTQYSLDNQPKELVFRLNDSAGQTHWLRSNSTVDKDERGKIQQVLGIFWDITADKQAAKQLRQSAALFENTAEAVIITDNQQKILAVNPAFGKITGYTGDEVLGRTPRILYQRRKEKFFYSQMWYLVEARACWQGEVYNQRKNGQLFPAWQNINAIYDDDNKIIQYIFSFSDISSLKETEQNLEHLAGHDPLTDLPNRILFNQHLENSIPYAQHNNQEIAILMIDLDRFKNINDSLGHHMGDEVIKNVAKRFSRCLDPHMHLARIGGDEFVCMIEGANMHNQAVITAKKLLHALKPAIAIMRQDVFVGASIGISVYPHDGTTMQTLIQNADTAMYRAKEHGRNQYSFYTSQLTADAMRRLSMETELRRALERDEFSLYYQPKIALASAHLAGAEALIRWIHPREGMVSPAHFIQLAEEVGLIEAMDEWVLYKACEQTQQWLQQGVKNFSIAVNLSHKQANRRNIRQIVLDALHTSGLPASALELEITEGFIMHNAEAAISNFKAFKEMGAQLSIDDFGTGYSSLSYLKKLPIDALKIDQSFVRDIHVNKDDRAIIQTIINLAHNLRLKVIAEGVENVEQLRYLQQHHCDSIQGYYFSRPLPASEFAHLFQTDFKRIISQAQS
jgi:diguanylate cyclase (GGDEF)-like protein/PAS domain S-box-containing protein